MLELKFGMAAILLASAASPALPRAEPYHLIPGVVPTNDWQGPNGNTIVLDAPDGLIVFDTGRSPDHAQAVLDYAKQRGRPIAAILNSHWHLDHTTGNLDLRQVYPRADVYATTAIEGALDSYLNRDRSGTDKLLADSKTPEQAKAQALRGRNRIDNPDSLRPTKPVLKSARMTIAGRELDMHVAPFAASEADLWVYDRKTRVALVGDLVVDIVPFMDSACPDGWAKALVEIEKVPFETLIPGHGAPMTRADFVHWKTAYNNMIKCGRSSVDIAMCAAGWERDAAKFIYEPLRKEIGEAVERYVTARLRSSPERQQKYCKTLRIAK